MIGIIPIAVAFIEVCFLIWVWTLYKCNAHFKNEEKWTMTIVSVFVAPIICIVFLAFTHDLLDDSPNNKKVETVINTLNIKSMKPTSNIRGSFVLGSGSIDTSDYFVTLVDVGNGYYRKMKFNVDSTVITESDGTPVVCEIESYDTNKLFTLLTGFNFFNKTTIYSISIPKGSIIESYQVM